ncbi:MAG: helix-turn-helix transcriptional regulator [Rhizobiaceae bacterium]
MAGTDQKSFGSPVDAEQVAGFVAMVGRRTRQARRDKAMSRRVLSEKSGVSQRYLAKLESGSGNVSIALLYQIAAALELETDRLLTDSSPANPRSAHILQMFEQASADQQREALEALQASDAAAGKAQRICLIGLRGAGKSTLGKGLAAALEIEFLELNSLIEEQSGMAISELMALYGQEGFRQLEKHALDTVLDTRQSQVLAVGGGIVLEDETYRALLQGAHTIWLKARPEEHMERVRAQGDNRPMANNPKAMDELRSILTSREDLYSRADAMVNTSNSSEAESLRQLVVQARKLMKQ